MSDPEIAADLPAPEPLIGEATASAPSPPRRRTSTSRKAASAKRTKSKPESTSSAEGVPAASAIDSASIQGEPFEQTDLIAEKPTPPTIEENASAHDSSESEDRSERRRPRGNRHSSRNASGRQRSAHREPKSERIAEAAASESLDSEPDTTNSDQPNTEGEESRHAGREERRPFKSRKQRFLERKEKERAREMAALEASPEMKAEGIVEISPKGFGFLRERARSFQQSPNDVFVTPEMLRTFDLRDGMMVRGISKQGVRGPQLMEITSINGQAPVKDVMLPYFEELTAINPNKKYTLETEASRLTTRIIDLVAPIGRGQRALIVAPPRTGKTTLLHHIAEGLQKNYEDEVHLMVMLVDERPEEVTEFERSFPDIEIFASSNDSEAKEHTRIALLAIERAKRLVESGQHVVLLVDSITRLARAFNNLMRGGGGRGTASGGLIVGALEMPRRIFAAARNTREAGSLTIIATALVQTNSKADEAIFQEFKGTGNMELVLDRQLAQNYIYPAVDINRSGTRREELLLPQHSLEKIYVIRRGLSGRRPTDAMEWLLGVMQRYPTNAQMLMDIKVTALS